MPLHRKTKCNINMSQTIFLFRRFQLKNSKFTEGVSIPSIADESTISVGF